MADMADDRWGVRELARAVLDSALPCRCAGCGRGASPLCPSCAAALGVAPVCTDRGSVPEFSLPDEDERIRSVLRAFKDRAMFAVRLPLAEAMRRVVAAAGAAVPDALIVRVPSRPESVARRGFDPLAELCGGIPVPRDAVWLCRVTRDQRGLSAAERARNLRLAFAADPAAVAGRDVVVCDDVSTTGSTLDALAQGIRAAGGRVCGRAVLVAIPPGSRHRAGLAG